MTSLCEALYLDNVISKQQLRRAIQRLCGDFASLTAGFPEASRLLASQMSDLSSKNLLSSKIITILPLDLVRNILAPSCHPFGQTFQRELVLLTDGRSAYYDKVDTLLDPYIDFFSRSDFLDTEEGSAEAQEELLKLRQQLRAFFTQDVILNKWASLNWVFVRRCVERVLAYDATVSESSSTRRLSQELGSPPWIFDTPSTL